LNVWYGFAWHVDILRMIWYDIVLTIYRSSEVLSALASVLLS
jgi:hypothetical protein